MTEKTPHIMVVDDELSMREVLEELEAVYGRIFGASLHLSQSGMFPKQVRPRFNAWRPLLLAGAAVLAVGLAGWRLSRSPVPPELGGHGPIADALGSPRQAAFSPTGDRIVYADEDPAGLPQAWIRSLAGGSPTQATLSSFAVEHPRWSSAGIESLIFGTAGGGVWSAAVKPGSKPHQLLERGSGPHLSPDGTRLAVGLDGRIWTASADGSELAPLTSVPQAFFARWTAMSPAYSPDGGEVAYFRPEVGSSGDLWVAPTGGGEARRLVGRTFRGGDPAWTPDGRWIVFWADFTGEIDLWTVPSGGGEPSQLTYGLGRHTSPEISADSRWLVYGSTVPSFVLERQDGASGERRQLTAARRGEIGRPEVSPTGDRIAFSSPDGPPAALGVAGPDAHLFVLDADSGGPLRVTSEAGERNVLPQWSADGSHLYYHQERPSSSLRKIALAGGDSRVVLEDWSWHQRYDTAVGPREDRVVYTPITFDGPQPLRVRELATGEERQLGAVLLTPRWSADGSFVLGADGDDRIHLCPAAGGDCRFLAEGFAPRWGGDGDSITFVRRTESARRHQPQPLSIWTLRLDGMVGHQLAEVEATSPLAFGYGLLAGGDLVWNRMTAGPEELWLAELR